MLTSHGTAGIMEAFPFFKQKKLKITFMGRKTPSLYVTNGGSQLTRGRGVGQE